MTDLLKQQAREIYLTIRALQEKMIRIKHERIHPPEEGASCVELTLPQFHALKVIEARESITIKELAEVLGVSAPSASAMVERLVEGKMLVREQSKADRRMVLVRLSETAKKTTASMEELILRELIELLEAIGPDWAQQWCDVYAKIREVSLGEKDIFS